MKTSIAVGAAMLLLVAAPAHAHQLDEYVQASLILVSRDQVRVELRMTPGVKVLPTVLAGIDAEGDGVLSDVEQRAYAERVTRDLSLAVDGTPLTLHLVASHFASIAEMKEGLGEIELELEASIPRGRADRRLTLVNLHERGISVYLANALVPSDPGLRITAQRRSYEQAFFELDYAQAGSLAIIPTSATTHASAGPTATELTGDVGMVRLGMRHTAEGTDHLLFLLVLLLPAPLVAAAGRWQRYAGARQGVSRLLRIVTAFTLGHSLTLAAAGTGWVRAPSAIVEVLIALSILVSAVHAIRPIFPGREALVAGGFGLVHGLAFATTIADYGIDGWYTVLTVFGFNVGIEVMQLAIVVATVPWLLSLARTPVYAFIRTSGAAVAGIAALGWIGERAFGMSNPIGPLVESAADRGPLLIAALALLAVGVHLKYRMLRLGFARSTPLEPPEWR